MKLLFKQRIFFMARQLYIYDEKGETVYTVKKDNSVLDINFLFIISMVNILLIKEEILTFLPRFALYENDEYIAKLPKSLLSLNLNLF